MKSTDFTHLIYKSFTCRGLLGKPPVEVVKMIVISISLVACSVPDET